ncbi:F-box/FBD/LRR-repeat protein At3g52680-like [Vicia villosa]|uniref:F-box/FBD/LRR-repeat protein At3g52680-like n=1 Tax=Vicia villosa TaxID=3911 RepID=UPI00273C1CD2|nr:F-box/FBD/LRR-repeat protein At3g52680-like [Vicia villosa]
MSIQDNSISILKSNSIKDPVSNQLELLLIKKLFDSDHTLPSISKKLKLRPTKDWSSSQTPLIFSPQDRISHLPDSILSHILSFLPTHLAVRTTILSKRFNPVWLSIPTFNMFDLYRTALLHSAMLAMLSRHTKVPILSFRLKCTFPEVVDDLILAAATKGGGVQTIQLDLMYSSLEMKTLSNLHSCKTLTVLKLTNVAIKESLSQIKLSFIKTLHLVDVIFKLSLHMINFFLGFPALEELHTDLVYVLGRMDFVPYPMVKCLPNLLTANISDIELTPLFHHSRSLILNLNKRPLLHIMHFPVFYNLTRIELVINFEQTWHAKWKWILKILQQSPNLQHLIIHQETETENGIDEKNWEDPPVVPECLLSQLRTCLFRLWRGTECELKFADYIMRNSKVLSSMTIRCSSSISKNTKDEILHKLSICPRDCKLIFS